MPFLKETLEFNKKFVEDKEYEAFDTNRFPDKKIAILSCMDTRLTGLLQAALNLKNGDSKVIKNAGAVITQPYGTVMRSLMIAIYELGIQEIFVIGHFDCGMQGLESAKIINKMIARGIPKEEIENVFNSGVDIHKWLTGFDDAETSVIETVKFIRTHPFVPKDVKIYGFMIDPKTGELHVLDDGTKNQK
ncbi:MAG: carbonic anhydrase [Methanimicrococcus sp.]|nr:carbonic anhydrase [Methanimicrococcus sp.]